MPSPHAVQSDCKLQCALCMKLASSRAQTVASMLQQMNMTFCRLELQEATRHALGLVEAEGRTVCKLWWVSAVATAPASLQEDRLLTEPPLIKCCRWLVHLCVHCLFSSQEAATSGTVPSGHTDCVSC